MKIKHLLLSVFFAFAAVPAMGTGVPNDSRVLKIKGYQPLELATLEEVLTERFKVDNVAITSLVPVELTGGFYNTTIEVLYLHFKISVDLNSHLEMECRINDIPLDESSGTNANVIEFFRCGASSINEKKGVRTDIEITPFDLTERDFGDRLQRMTIRKITLPPGE